MNSIMKNDKILLRIVLASLVLFVGYCWILIDWFQDMNAGRFENEPQDWVLEVGVVLAYCYLAFRFFQSKQAGSQQPVKLRKENSRIRSLKYSYSLIRKMAASATDKKVDATSKKWLPARQQRLR